MATTVDERRAGGAPAGPGAPEPSDVVRTEKEAHRRSRSKLKPAEQIKVWTRAGGVCEMCGKYLLDGPLTGLGVSLGELAHIVGQQSNAASPRGLSSLPAKERDFAENVLLACPSCHSEIDKQLVAQIVDVEALTKIKTSHEQRIRHLVSLDSDARTVVLRLVGVLRGNPLELSDKTVASAVVAGGRYPWFDLDRHRIGVEIDVRGLPGELDGEETYFAAAARAIDEVIAYKLHDGVKSGEIRHVSVFPYARLPLVIYLGSRLEDNITVDAYQRHRSTQEWAWPEGAQTHQFDLQIDDEVSASQETLLALNVSGSIDDTELPETLRGLPTIRITPRDAPSPDIVTSTATLAAFCEVVRNMNAYFDAHKSIRTVHVFGALPPAPAIELGRLHDPHIHPAFVLYDRKNDGSYRRALEIS